MKRSAPILFLLALVTLIAYGCGSSSSGGSLTPDYSGFYSIREPDAGGGPTKLLRYSAGGVTTVATLDFSPVTTTLLPTFNLNSAGAAFDPASKAIYGLGAVTDGNIVKSLVFKVDIVTGSLSGFAESTSVGFSDVQISGNDAYVFTNEISSGAEAVVRYPLAGGTPAAPVSLTLEALYPDYSVDIVRSSVAFDGASGKAYLLLSRMLSGPKEFSIVRADLATGALEAPIELGSTYILGNLFLKGSDLYMTGEDSLGSSKVLKVPAAGGSLSIVSTLDFTTIYDATHTEAHLARYSKAIDQGGSVIMLPIRMPDNTGGSDLNVLVAVNLATGAVAKLDTVVGCYFMNAFVP